LNSKASALSSSALSTSSTGLSSAFQSMSEKAAVVRPPYHDKSLRERVVHLLGLKSYSKPELFLRLNKGMPLNDKEKEGLESIIQSVAVYNSKSSQYDLTTEILLNEVKEDWPQYNPFEKKSIKNIIFKAKEKQNGTSGPRPNISTSNGNKQSLNSISGRQSLPNPSAFVSLQHKTPLSNDKKISPSKVDDRMNIAKPNLNQNKNKTSPPPSQQQRPNNDIEMTDTTVKATKQINEKENDKNENHSLKKLKKSNDNNSINSIINDIHKQYKQIDNETQRNQYKNDFDKIYNEYYDLHDYMNTTAKTFDDYKTQMNSIKDKESKEYIEKRNKVFDHFKRNNVEHSRKTERYNYLYEKLNLIQNLITQYDSSRSLESLK
jgi:hypothetical protein